MKPIKLYFLIFISFFGLTCCSEKKYELAADEVYISRHIVGPPIKKFILFVPPGTATAAQDAAINLDSLYQANPCLKPGLSLSHSVIYPHLKLYIDKDGKVKGYYNNCRTNKSGYFTFTLKDTFLSFVNKRINYIQNKKYKSGNNYIPYNDMIYDGPSFFVSIKKGDNEKQVFILHREKGAREIVTLIDSLYSYASTLQLLQKRIDFPEMDSIIVLKTEQFYKL